MDPQEMQQQMELQLHEQYAINNNANLNSIIILIVGLFAALGSYGYVFLHSANYFEDVINLNDSIKYSLTQLTYALIGAAFVIEMMIYICMYQGVAQRCEQFIIYAIRCNYGKKDFIENIFPSGYNPFNKKRLEIVQGLYGELIKIGIGALILIILSYCYKIFMNIYICKEYGANCQAIILVVISTILIIIISIIVGIVCHHQTQKYETISSTYNKKEFIHISSEENYSVPKNISWHGKICLSIKKFLNIKISKVVFTYKIESNLSQEEISDSDKFRFCIKKNRGKKILKSDAAHNSDSFTIDLNNKVVVHTENNILYIVEL